MPGSGQQTTRMTPLGSPLLVLDRYRLIERIGRGGFSTVYRAEDLKMGRQVAVKAIRRTEEQSSRARHEARAAAKLSNPHIVTVFELVEDEQNVYLVSELVEGTTLARRIAEASLTDREAIMISLQVLEALEHAHSRGVIHRDIKPDNIMLASSRGAAAKVMDFGIAQLENSQRLTRRGDVVGTLAYMSPEQADGKPVDGATDVYSTALTLYECLAGFNPFKGEGAAETIAKITAGALPLSHLRPDLGESLSRLVGEAMEPDPLLRLGLNSFAAGLVAQLPAGAAERKTALLRKARERGPALRQAVAARLGFLAPRAANGALAALVAWMALYGSSYYPLAWRLPLLLGAALAVGVLPRLGLAGLAVMTLLPVAAYSVALGALLTGAAAAYYFVFGLAWPRSALLPALAPGLGALGLGLAYPAVAGSLGRLRRGIVLALLGGIVFTAFQLFSKSANIDFLGIPNSFSLPAKLAGSNNPVYVIRELARPFWQQPVLGAQPLIWMAAALPAALLIRRRRLWADLAGLAFSNSLLAGGYLALPLLFNHYRLPSLFFMKTLLICAIIQVVLILLSPRARPPAATPHELA